MSNSKAVGPGARPRHPYLPCSPAWSHTADFSTELGSLSSEGKSWSLESNLDTSGSSARSPTFNSHPNCTAGHSAKSAVPFPRSSPPAEPQPLPLFASRRKAPAQHERQNLQHESRSSLSKQHQGPPLPPAPHAPELSTLQALRKVYGFSTKRDSALLLLPAVLLSIVCGLLPPYMTIMIGNAFQNFTEFVASTSDPLISGTNLEEAKQLLQHRIGLVSLKLALIGVATLLLSLIAHTLWSVSGSRITQKIQEEVYTFVSEKELAWFESGMQTQRLPLDLEKSMQANTNSPHTPHGVSESPAGLMGRFTRQTEDIRAAISGRQGLMVQYSVTMLANIILAFLKSYKLSLSILCTIPVVTLLTVVCSRMTMAPLAKQSFLESELSSEVGRVVKSIPVVKAFNAQPLEVVKLLRMSRDLSQTYLSLVRIWVVRLGLCQCLSLLMFVQGFGFGAKLISTHEVTAGDVNTVFWACLVASSYLQMLMPLLSSLEKAKSATSQLLAWMEVDKVGTDRRQKLADSLQKVDVSRSRSMTLSKTPNSPPTLVPLNELAWSMSHGSPAGSSQSRPPISISSTRSNIDSLSGSLDRGRKVSVPLSLTSSRPLLKSFTAKSPTVVMKNKRMRKLRKVIPTEFRGQVELQYVTFYYPRNQPGHQAWEPPISSRSTQVERRPDLDNVSATFPAGYFTYIVGESGSGKSTISSIILGLYPIFGGSVEIDDIGSIEWFDPTWYRSQIALVSGLTCHFILPGTIHENIAIGAGSGRDWRTVSREEVVQAAKFALLHNFVRNLPEGYETKLVDDSASLEGVDGSPKASTPNRAGQIQSLSGGEKQRLGLARAYIRDPKILILDEATSALDLANQTLMYDALRRWRAGKTTICITHDFTPIRQSDYVYVMQHGRVVECDFRYMLECKSSRTSVFKKMTRRASQMKLAQSSPSGQSEDRLQSVDSSFTKRKEDREDGVSDPRSSCDGSRKKEARRVTFIDGLIHAMQSDNAILSLQTAKVAPGFPFRQSGWGASDFKKIDREEEVAEGAYHADHAELKRRESRRSSLLSPFSTSHREKSNSLKPERAQARKTFQGFTANDEDDYQEFVAAVMLQASKLAPSKRPAEQPNCQAVKPAAERDEATHHVNDWSENASLSTSTQVATTLGKSRSPQQDVEVYDPPSNSFGSLVTLWKKVSPMIPRKWLFSLGLFLSLASGAMTPVFSVLLGNLLSKISDPPAGYILRTSLWIILVSMCDGALAACKVFVMETVSTEWLENMRRTAVEKIVLQDQAWFDQAQNSPSSLINRLVKDGADCKDIIGQIASDAITILTLIFMAFLWALILGWQLTLIGLSLIPIFFVVIGFSGKVGARLEQLNKVLRENVANEFHLSIANVRAIRSMSIEPIMRARFENATETSKKMFIRASPFGGMAYGLNVALTYLAEGLMFYAGALLVIHGIFTFARLSQVFSLIIFSVTFAGQMITSIPSFTKCLQATIDLYQLVSLPLFTQETSGDLSFPIKGRIEFNRVNFSYPSRPGVQVLKSVSFVVEPGECVGVVGTSGSGKSTIALLLHRLYKPNSGSIRLDGFNILQIDSRHVRDNIGMVSQQPVLFNATVLENLSYGHVPVRGSDGVAAKVNELLLRKEVDRVTKQAHLDEFLGSLPQGLDTKLGENSDLISSGQAQRISIGRTLLRKNRQLLIFDECTSALDSSNQTEILKTIEEVKQGKTSIIITHKTAEMRMCDRLVVLDQGRVVEQGTFSELMNKPNGRLKVIVRTEAFNS